MKRLLCLQIESSLSLVVIKQKLAGGGGESVMMMTTETACMGLSFLHQVLLCQRCWWLSLLPAISFGLTTLSCFSLFPQSGLP